MKSILIFCCLVFVFADMIFAQSKKISSYKAKPIVPACKLTEAPRLRGFYLGQTVDEIQNMMSGFREAYEFQKRDRTTDFPLSDWRKEIDPTIASEIDLVYISSASAFAIDSDRKLLTSADYEDVNIIWWFMEEKLFAYGIYYSELEVDQDAKKFIKQVAAKTAIPAKGWRKILTPNIDSAENRAAHVVMDHVEAELRCAGFKIFLNAGYRDAPHLIITDTTAEADILRLGNEIKQRKKKEEQERLRLEREKRTTFKP